MVMAFLTLSLLRSAQLMFSYRLPAPGSPKFNTLIPQNRSSVTVTVQPDKWVLVIIAPHPISSPGLFYFKTLKVFIILCFHWIFEIIIILFFLCSVKFCTDLAHSPITFYVLELTICSQTKIQNTIILFLL